MLIAGDDPSLASQLCQVVETLGYEVLLASDSASALHSWRMDRPQLMLLGVALQGVSGIDLCRQIREDDSLGSDTPIIIVTAGSSEDEIIGGFVAGADDYVSRSFSASQLAARIRAVLRRRGLLDEDGLELAPRLTSWTQGAATEPCDFTGFLALVPAATAPAPVIPIRPEAWMPVVVRTEHQELHVRRRNLGCA